VAIDVEEGGVTPAVHFVAFRGEEYWSAVRVWGRPAFIHRRYDQRARRELHPKDTVVFAKGCDQDAPSRFNGSDIEEGL
jgi:hypothetical protein